MLVQNDSNVILPKGKRMYYEHFKLKLQLYQSETGTQFDLSPPSQQLAFPFSKDIHERQVTRMKSKMQNRYLRIHWVNKRFMEKVFCKFDHLDGYQSLIKQFKFQAGTITFNKKKIISEVNFKQTYSILVFK